jgi:hypothetical protein
MTENTGPTINWKHVDYVNAKTFLRLMTTWAVECGYTDADIEQQEQIVKRCKAELDATEEATI